MPSESAPPRYGSTDETTDNRNYVIEMPHIAYSVVQHNSSSCCRVDNFALAWIPGPPNQFREEITLNTRREPVGWAQSSKSRSPRRRHWGCLRRSRPPRHPRDGNTDQADLRPRRAPSPNQPPYRADAALRRPPRIGPELRCKSSQIRSHQQGRDGGFADPGPRGGGHRP